MKIPGQFSVTINSGGTQNGLGGGLAQDDGSASTTTFAAISDGNIEVRSNADALNDANLKRSKEQAHQVLERIFDPNSDIKALEEQVEATKLFAEEGFKLVGDVYQKAEDARKKADDARELYEKGAYSSLAAVERLEADAVELESKLPDKAIAHAIVGGLTAAIGGGDFLQGATAAGLNELASKHLADNIDDPVVKNLIASVIGGALGGEQGALITGTADKFNRQLHPTELEFLEDKERIQRYRDKVAKETGREISVADAEDALKVAALVIVSQSWEDNLHIEADPLATSFLAEEAEGHSYLDVSGEKQGLLVATEAERQDDFINLEYYSQVRQGLQSVLPDYDLSDALEGVAVPWALIKGVGNEIKSTVMDAVDTADVVTDPETYAKLQRIATMLKEDPERAEALLNDAAQALVDGLKADLTLLDNKLRLYQDQKRIHDEQVTISEITLAVANPFKKVTGGVDAVHTILKAIPNDKLNLPETNNSRDGATENSAENTTNTVADGSNIATNRTLPSGSPYSQADYDAYVQRKLDAGETPRSPEDYISVRKQFDKGSAAHTAAVETEVDILQSTYGPNARIVENRAVSSADGCVTCRPDIMVYDPQNRTLHVVEVKTGDASLTLNQQQVYPNIADGSASMNASQLQALSLPTEYAGRPLSEIPGLNIVVEEVRH